VILAGLQSASKWLSRVATGQPDCNPLAPELERETPGIRPQLECFRDKCEYLRKVAEHGEFFFGPRPLHQFRQDDAGTADLSLVDKARHDAEIWFTLAKKFDPDRCVH
jgi:hypothetical protein